MRIARLHLRAYGHFTEFSLDFGTAPGLHMIYGDNESGKTTTLRALSSALFGYPHRAVDAFKHNVNDIAVGADLVADDGRALSFLRSRTGRNKLTGGGGAPLEESSVAAFLGGITQEVFERVFALDHLRLRQHADALLAEGGALGFTLVEAGAGVAGLKAVLQGLRERRESFFLGRGSTPKLNQLIRRLGDLRKEARERTISPEQYRKLRKQADEIADEIEAARARQRILAANIEQLRRIERNLPRRAERAALTERLADLDSVPLLPGDATEQRVRAQSGQSAAKQALQAAGAATDDLEGKLATTIVDTRILAEREEIERLAERRAWIEKAMEDQPRRESELEQHRRLVADYLRQAELAGTVDDLDRILPSALKRSAIAALAKQGAALAAKRTAAAEQLDEAARELASAQEAAGKASEPQDAGPIQRALADADRLGDIAEEIGRRRSTLARKGNVLREHIAGLGLAGGETSTLRSLVVPAEQTVRRYAVLVEGIGKDIESTHGELARLASEIEARSRQIIDLKKSGEVATEEELRAARAAREEGWRLIRGIHIEGRADLDDEATAFAPDGRLPEAYERRVAEADRIADALRAHVEEATQLSLIASEKAALEERRTAAAKRLQDLESGRSATLEEWRRLWPAAINPQPPGEMTEWLARRAKLLAEADELATSDDEIRLMTQRTQAAVEALVASLQASAVPALADEGLDALRERARRLCERIAAEKLQHEKAQDAKRLQERRRVQAEEGLAKLDTQIAEWRTQWQAALTAAGLPSTHTTESASAVLAVMNALDLEKRSIDELRHRIETMESDRTGFSLSVGKLAHLLSDTTADNIDNCRRLEAALKEAMAAELRQKGYQSELSIRRSELQKAQSDLERSSAKLERLCDQAGCSDLRDLADFERRSAEKQDKLRRREELESAVRRDGAGLSLDALFAECDGIDGNRIAGDIADSTAEGERLAQQIDALNVSKGALDEQLKALESNNQAADSVQDIALVEAEAAAVVDAYVDLTLQETLLRRAIDLYRERNQGPILGRAKALFAELTNGAYSGLRADIDDKNQPILIAEERVRGSLEVPALSDGTVDPLYLSLRLAVIEGHNAAREPLPFIADDLLLSFDNPRAEAALRTLGRIAASGQVLFFTHHPHMLELARSAVPKELLREHRLLGGSGADPRSAHVA